MFALLLAALATSPAHADSGLWMWGVGPTLGTIVYPGRFPAALGDYPNLEGRVRGDVITGGHLVAYIDGENRLGSHVDLGFGSGYTSAAWTLEYERILMRGSGIHVFAGGGLGFGTYTLRDDAGKLNTPTYELRGQVGALYKQKQTAEELSLFVKLPINGNPTYTPEGGTKEDATNAGNWFHIGLMATVYFGDWTMPRKGNK
ncbi:MAG: hypothetical protein D6798_21215 [Deltaproteobacteria bacterium]|nr:MAG: hypothetical protein D6798_21215 [Deltaproteobacteria bacterium]